MKKIFFLSAMVISVAVLAAFAKKNADEEPVQIPPSAQRTGDAAKGYDYLTTGDYLRSGVPYKYFIMLRGKDKNNYLNRTGKNATVAEGYNVVAGLDSIDVVVPTCLQCHSQVFNGQLIVGLGNTFLDFTNTKKTNGGAVRMLKQTAPRQYKAGEAFFTSFATVYPKLQSEVRGVNTADRLAELLVAHRNPQTLVWSSDELLKVPDEVIPTDVPAWWLLKKKNAMFYTGFARGDFGKFLMLSNILTASDSSETADVNSHFGDVLAYIRSIKAPVYPKQINEPLALKGKAIFTDNCSRCHGTYGNGGEYPNLLVPESIIGTDSALLKANQQNQQFIDWFNKSWFAGGVTPANLVPSNGYVAPPLDGVWVTAPYFHNGSVPTLEAVLNSKLRPIYWSRSYNDSDYNYQSVGWNYHVLDSPLNNTTYNTMLHGYGNYGHYFGDALTDAERKAVIEYLKTL